MRAGRIVVAVLFAGAVVVAGCSGRAANEPREAPEAPTSASEAAPVVRTTVATQGAPAEAACEVSPGEGLAGSRTTLRCSGFAPSEQVTISFQAEVLTIAKASAGGEVSSSFPVPSGFAGSHYPGRKDTFEATGQRSGNVAAATFTVTG